MLSAASFATLNFTVEILSSRELLVICPTVVHMGYLWIHLVTISSRLLVSEEGHEQ